ncbi:MAG: hypothetical protein G8345_13355 [Magnetococcales bacterium]|nr:hypothetical protein [Magnetococcales bacterium]NGZ27861.1 hypothetical protein [Magnetococcales bacterium]
MEPLWQGCSRRHVIKLGVGTILTSVLLPSGGVSAKTYQQDGLLNLTKGVKGCCLQGKGADAMISRLQALSQREDEYDDEEDEDFAGDPAEMMIHRSGNDRLDRSLGILLADMASKMGVRPGFAYMDDGDSPNAFAIDASWLPHTKGTVLFGRNLLQKNLARDIHGDMLVMGICAHEFGHIVQYDYDVSDRLQKRQTTHRLMELHADFLSGYYVGLRNFDYSKQQMISLGRAWEELGDSNFTDPDHHGTSQERIAAMEQGYLTATQRKAPIREAIRAGLHYLGV